MRIGGSRIRVWDVEGRVVEGNEGAVFTTDDPITTRADGEGYVVEGEDRWVIVLNSFLLRCDRSHQ